VPVEPSEANSAQVAHRINNRLTVIVGALELVAESDSLTPDLRTVVSAALRAADDLSALVDEMKQQSGLGAANDPSRQRGATVPAG
jgi:signal transduction histidine kinase